MVESSLAVGFQASEIMMSPNLEEFEVVVNHLFLRHDSEEYQTAHALYNFSVSAFQSSLILKLLALYQASSDSLTRFRSIYQLYETLTDFRNRDVVLPLDSLDQIKSVLVSLLKAKETKESDMKILRRIVSCVAYNVVMLHQSKWDELSDCILWLADREHLKAFHVFVDLPRIYKEFIDKIFETILQRADNVILDPYRDEDWSLALQTFVKMWIQLCHTGMEFEAVKSLMMIKLTSVMDSVRKLVRKGKEHFLLRGLQDFERFFSRDMNMYQYTENQCHFVFALMTEIEGVVVETQTKEVARKIKLLVTEQGNLAIKEQDDLKIRREEFTRYWNEHLKKLSALEIWRIFASPKLEDWSREIAIRRFYVILDKSVINSSEISELQALLISCLSEGLSDSIFEVLGKVVTYFAYELFTFEDAAEDAVWHQLCRYIASDGTEFKRAVYMFQCLAMALIENCFVYPVMDNILPMISENLSPPREVLVDNSGWVLAFTGGFCAVVRLIEYEVYNEQVKEIAYKMIDSVRTLVGRGTEVGIVRRAFRDMESIVKKQLDFYEMNEYKFVKGLLWRLYETKGMKWESKYVLWRINVILERRVELDEKKHSNDDADWLNLNDDEEDDEEEEEVEWEENDADWLNLSDDEEVEDMDVED